MNTSRRQFLKTGACLGCLAVTCPSSVLADSQSDCKQALEDQFLRFQQRDMAEKAGLFRTLTTTHGNGILHTVQQFVIDETRLRMEQNDITDRTIGGALQYLWNHTGVTHQFQVLEQSGTQLKLKVTRCFYAEEMKKLNAGDIGLAFYCAYDIGFTQGLNPRMKFTRTRTLMEGHDCCDHAYTLQPL